MFDNSWFPLLFKRLLIHVLQFILAMPTLLKYWAILKSLARSFTYSSTVNVNLTHKTFDVNTTPLQEQAGIFFFFSVVFAIIKQYHGAQFLTWQQYLLHNWNSYEVM